jgi:hypothetical protein
LNQKKFLRALVCLSFLLWLASSLFMSSFGAQWRGPSLRKLSIITFAVCHPPLKSLDRTPIGTLNPLKGSTSKWSVDPRRSSWKTHPRLYSLEVLTLAERILVWLMTVPRSMCALIVGTIYSSRHGLPWLLLITSSFILLLCGYFDCTPTTIAGSSRNFIIRNWIGVRSLAADCCVLLHIKNGVVLLSRNVHAK